MTPSEQNLANQLIPSCRVALAAYLHDLGKFSQRAKIPLDKNLINDHKLQYCPKHPNGGWWSHVHAAYTALSFDLLEKHFPEIIGEDVYPFAKWGDTRVDDSIINAAARHHQPETALQWIIATADRVASGFERENFEQYNQAKEDEHDKNETGKTFYQVRLMTLFEQISFDSDSQKNSKDQFNYRYPLKPLSVDSIYPQLAQGCEPSDNKTAQQQYKKLWDGFIKQIKDIPKSHQRLDLWLDHFDSLWQTYTHAIPSATAGKTKPDVSLYDHSKATSAIAVALWRYYEENNISSENIIKGLEYGGSKKYKSDWEQKQLLLIQGDLFGIQNFIFSEGSQSNKQVAKLLRGRSFYVSLLAETAALKILESLGLPTTSQIINAAGKFLIVAPNTDTVKQQLKNIKLEINQWFLEKTYGQTGLGLAWQEACCNNFISSTKEDKNAFSQLISQLFSQLEEAKLQRFDLCTQTAPNPVFSHYLDHFELGVCAYNNKLPADSEREGLSISSLSLDQINTGEHLSKYSRFVISKEKLSGKSLALDLFGYYIHFTDNEEHSGKFGPQVKNNNIRRVYDFSLAENETEILFNGYARRNINTYVATFSSHDLTQQQYNKYDGLSKEENEAIIIDNIKPFTHLAYEDREADAQTNKWIGIKALSTLKGDIDNLGKLFEQGLKQPTFAKMASFSRQINNFFALALPMLCKKEFPNSYTIFAGGDDFFLMGPWLSQQKLVRAMQIKFYDYVAKNNDIHFSAGLLLTKSNIPIPTLAVQAEHELEKSKSYQKNDVLVKNAITVFGRTLDWTRYEQLFHHAAGLFILQREYDLSASYIYGLIELSQMAEQAESQPKKAIWHSWFSYRTARMCKDRLKLKDEELKNAIATIGNKIAIGGIKTYRADYLVALYNYLYQQRK